LLKAIIGLPSTVWLLGLVSLFNDSASELVYPLVPIYLASVLMAGPKSLGIIEGIAEATGSLLKLFSGVITDKTRATKSWVIGGYGLATLGRPLLAFASSWPVMLALRFADRVGKGLRTSPRDAMLVQSIRPEQRGLAFGLHRAMDNAGAVIGPLLASLLLSFSMPIREILLWSAIPGFIAVGVAFCINEPARAIQLNKVPFVWSMQGFPEVFKRYLLVLSLFTLGNSSNMFLLLRARDMGLPESQIPLLWAFVSATAMIFSTPLSALSDKWGRKRLIIGGWVVYSLFYLFLGLNGHNLWLLWPSFALYGVFMAATEGAEKALVADIAPKNLIGTAYGWYNLVVGFMLLPASLIFGCLWQSISPAVAFGFSTSCALIAAALLKWWIHLSEPMKGTSI